MNRLDILSKKSVFMKEFPDKSNLVVDYSLPELLCLFYRLRKDAERDARIIKLDDISAFEVFKETMIKHLVVTSDKCGIINGVIYFPRDVEIKDFITFRNLLFNRNSFVSTLFNLHNDQIKLFIKDNSGNMCGNVLLHCTDDEFRNVINSIDFEFTTVSNILTCIRSDLVFDETFGRIRTNNNVYLINLKQSYLHNACVGTFIDKLKG